MTWRTPLNDANGSPAARVTGVGPRVEELEGGCEQVDAWRHCPTSRPSPQ